MKNRSSIHYSVSAYYSDKVKIYGPCPRGVDWNGLESQTLRFKQLSRIFESDDLGTYTVLDFGCGYGALFAYLEQNFENVNYCGLDLSAEMVQEALRLYGDQSNALFKVGGTVAPKSVDYVIGSGIFSVKLENEPETWRKYIEDTLDMFNASCKKGFAFNCLTTYSDEDMMREHLYYANPESTFKWCKENYSKNVSLLHDYDLYEFTILVRK